MFRRFFFAFLFGRGEQNLAKTEIPNRNRLKTRSNRNRLILAPPFGAKNLKNVLSFIKFYNSPKFYVIFEPRSQLLPSQFILIKTICMKSLVIKFMTTYILIKIFSNIFNSVQECQCHICFIFFSNFSGYIYDISLCYCKYE